MHWTSSTGPGGRAARRAAPRVARLRTATATSAGGIVIRYEDRSATSSWSAGGAASRDGVHLDAAQGHADRAARRPRRRRSARSAEETGPRGPDRPARFDSIEYSFVQRGTRIHKTVHYFLMEPIGGDLGRHDHEFDEVRWIRFDEAPTLLTFETERALVARAAAARLPAASRARPRRRERDEPMTETDGDPSTDPAARSSRGARARG